MYEVTRENAEGLFFYIDLQKTKRENEKLKVSHSDTQRQERKIETNAKNEMFPRTQLRKKKKKRKKVTRRPFQLN